MPCPLSPVLADCVLLNILLKREVIHSVFNCQLFSNAQIQHTKQGLGVDDCPIIENINIKITFSGSIYKVFYLIRVRQSDFLLKHFFQLPFQQRAARAACRSHIDKTAQWSIHVCSIATALFHSFFHLSNFYTLKNTRFLRHFHGSFAHFPAKSQANNPLFSVCSQMNNYTCALFPQTVFLHPVFYDFSQIIHAGFPCYAPRNSFTFRLRDSTARSISCLVVSFPSVIRTVPAAYSSGTPIASIT